MSISVLGQKNKGKAFDIEDFNEKTRTVEWFYNYDAIAGWTSDSDVIQDSSELRYLGKEWIEQSILLLWPRKNYGLLILGKDCADFPFRPYTMD